MQHIVWICITLAMMGPVAALEMLIGLSTWICYHTAHVTILGLLLISEIFHFFYLNP